MNLLLKCFCLQSLDNVILVSYKTHLTQDAKLPQHKTSARDMTLQDLKDLQSRLMLIMGKDSKVKEDVEKFVEVPETWIFFLFLFESERVVLKFNTCV